MDIKQLNKNWTDYIEKGLISPTVQPLVAESWQKCRRMGVDPSAGKGKRASEAVIESIKLENKQLLEVALPIMQSIYDIAQNSNTMIVLTDSAGYILETVCNGHIATNAKSLRFEVGTLWSDLEVGSNAIGIALDYDSAIQMIGPEHYCLSHHGWTCSASPIHNLNGDIIGCINMSGELGTVHMHTLGLIRLAAYSIEQQLFSRYNSRLMRSALDGNIESIFFLDEQFHPVWVNTAARRILEISPELIDGADFRHLLPEVDWHKIEKWNENTHFITSNTPLVIDGNTQYGSVIITSAMMAFGQRGFTVQIKKQEQVIKSVNELSGNRANYTFDDIYTANPMMRKVVTLAQRFARYDGPVLIQGEVGTEKGELAQSIHNASERADGPFVTVNCASLPRDLFETVLFGYERGVVRGAMEDGFPGKIEMADHGTLFLDEIGETPLEYQAELLQVFRSGKVRRIGAAQEKDIDIRVVVASDRNLRLDVESGRFRSDLYFQLNVLSLDVPPMRERSEDIVLCADYFLEHFNARYPAQHKSMSESFIENLESYSWPGNTRELQNVIERAFFGSVDEVLEQDDLTGIIEQSGYGSNCTQIYTSQYPVFLGRQGVVEYSQIVAALESSNGKVEDAAEALGMSRASLYRRIKELRINLQQMRV
jgi:transcriptional regulator of acetoin/glycerol metabolism